jgi:hypothetical protein
LTFEDTAYGSFTAMGSVPAAGFSWEEDSGGKPYLVENSPAGDRPWRARTAPLGHGNSPDARARLAITFSHLKTREDYLVFANEHGQLGHPTQPDPLALWETHTRRVRVLFALMKWTWAGDEEKLAWVVRWPEGEDQPLIRPGAALDYLDAIDAGRPYQPIPDEAVIERGRTDATDLAWFWKIPWRRIHEPGALHDSRWAAIIPEGRRRWSAGEVIGPAHFYVCEELNRAVKGHVNTKLMPFAPSELFRLYVVPDCLLATIYLQLQLIMARGLVDWRWKKCEADGCLKFFPKNGHQLYCSSPCRDWGRKQAQRTYREKSKQQPKR